MWTNLTSQLTLVSEILHTWPRANTLEKDAKVVLSFIAFYVHEQF